MKSRAASAAFLLFVFAGCGTLIGVDKDYAEGPTDGGATDAPVGEAAPTDGPTTTDAAGDGPGDSGSDAGCPGGHICGGVCLSGASCDGCAQGNLFCSATRECVSSCAACAGGATECWSCGGPQPAGTCEPTATAYCFGAGYTHCPCTDAGASTCPGATQVCRIGKCLSCGEPGTDGYRCKAFSECVEATNTCHN